MSGTYTVNFFLNRQFIAASKFTIVDDSATASTGSGSMYGGLPSGGPGMGGPGMMPPAGTPVPRPVPQGKQ